MKKKNCVMCGTELVEIKPYYCKVCKKPFHYPKKKKRRRY